MVDMEEETETNSDKMKNVFQLRKDMDSITQNNAVIVVAFSKNITERMGIQLIDTPLVTPQDSIFSALPTDSLPSINKVLNWFDPLQGSQIIDETINTVTMAALTSAA